MHLRALVLVTIGFSPVQKGIWSEIRGFLLGTSLFYVRGSRACRDSVSGWPTRWELPKVPGEENNWDAPEVVVAAAQFLEILVHL